MGSLTDQFFSYFYFLAPLILSNCILSEINVNCLCLYRLRGLAIFIFPQIAGLPNFISHLGGLVTAVILSS